MAGWQSQVGRGRGVCLLIRLERFLGYTPAGEAIQVVVALTVLITDSMHILPATLGFLCFAAWQYRLCGAQVDDRVLPRVFQISSSGACRAACLTHLFPYFFPLTNRLLIPDHLMHDSYPPFLLVGSRQGSIMHSFSAPKPRGSDL